MGHTETPALDPQVLERLEAYSLAFRPLFARSDQFRQGQIYLHGLLLGITPLDRGHAATAPADWRGLGGRPRRLGGIQAGRGTW
jgi:hypothetical protein